MYSLDVIVPFYNEEKFLERSVKNLIKENIHDKIYLVNNCSTDNSEEIAKSLSKNREDIIYLETNISKGKGLGIQTAIQYLESTHTIIHDADLEYFPNDIKTMKELSIKNQNSLVLGSRFIGEKERFNRYRRTIFANRFLSNFFSFIHGNKVSDIATCYKLIPNKYLKKMNLSENGFAIEIEIIAKYLKMDNTQIIEVPIRYEGRSFEDGKKIKLSDGFQYIFKIIYYKLLKF
jgi:dolichol-phosphate mannosyltransferase